MLLVDAPDELELSDEEELELSDGELVVDAAAGSVPVLLPRLSLR